MTDYHNKYHFADKNQTPYYLRKTFFTYTMWHRTDFSFIHPPAKFISDCFQDHCPAANVASNTEYFQLVVLYSSGS